MNTIRLPLNATLEQYSEWFFQRVEKTESCWIWKGYTNKKGYGMCTALAGGGSAMNVARAAWIIHHGSAPKGKEIRKSCRNLLCVNPDHLFAGVPSDTPIAYTYEQMVAAFWARVVKSDGCWTWIGTKFGPMGYGVVRWRRKNTPAHKLSWILANGEIPVQDDVLCVCHKCDNPVCVRPDHLFLGTYGDNIRDMASKGRHGMAKLTIQDVVELRNMRNAGASVAETAAKYNLCQTHVSMITNRRAWKHVQ